MSCESIRRVGAAEPKTATAELKNAAGARVATAQLTELDNGVRVVLDVSDLPPGTHGVHIHDVGKCDPPGFTTAGPHFNPGGKQHGSMNPQGQHAGDLGNLEVSSNGTGTLDAVAHGAKLSGSSQDSLLRSGGTALVIHGGADDLKTDPAGNSGPRIACGVITH